MSVELDFPVHNRLIQKSQHTPSPGVPMHRHHWELGSPPVAIDGFQYSQSVRLTPTPIVVFCLL